MIDDPKGVGAGAEAAAARAALHATAPTPEVLGAVHHGLHMVPDDVPPTGSTGRHLRGLPTPADGNRLDGLVGRPDGA